jgi:hypothetical protein
MAALCVGCVLFLSQQLGSFSKRIRKSKEHREEYAENYTDLKTANQKRESLLSRKSDASVPEGIYDNDAPPPSYDVATKSKREARRQRVSETGTASISIGRARDEIAMHTTDLREGERIEGRDMALR